MYIFISLSLCIPFKFLEDGVCSLHGQSSGDWYEAFLRAVAPIKS